MSNIQIPIIIPMAIPVVYIIFRFISINLIIFRLNNLEKTIRDHFQNILCMCSGIRLQNINLLNNCLSNLKNPPETEFTSIENAKEYACNELNKIRNELLRYRELIDQYNDNYGHIANYEIQRSLNELKNLNDGESGDIIYFIDYIENRCECSCNK